MVLLVEKLGRSLRFPSKLEDRRLKSDAISSSLPKFRSKLSEFIAGILLPGSEISSLAGFNKCFDLIHAANRAFAEMAADINYPMRQWGPNLTDVYLTSTSDFLRLLNVVASSASHLTHAKMSLLHAVALHSTTPPPAARPFNKIATAAQVVRLERAIGRGERPRSPQPQEHALLHALILCKKIGSLALGFVVSGLCGDVEPYLEIRRNRGEFESDPLLKDLDSRFYLELMGSQGVMKEVREVNMAVDHISANGCAEDLKRRLKVLENSLERIEKQSSDAFSQVVNARNKLLSSIRFPE